MKRLVALIAASTVLTAGSGLAADSLMGTTWKTVDEKSGKVVCVLAVQPGVPHPIARVLEAMTAAALRDLLMEQKSLNEVFQPHRSCA